jgi:predicted Zn-dependent peptidase
MTSILIRAASLTCAAVLLAAAPSPTASRDRYPTAQVLTAGDPSIVVESDDGALLTGVQIFVAAGLDRQDAATSGVASLLAECIARTPVQTPGGALPLVTAIANEGGSLSYSVDARTTHFYLESRPQNTVALLHLFATAFAKPDFSTATLRAARLALGARASDVEGNALAVGISMFRHSYYTGGAGMPALGTAASIARLGSADLAAFYAKNYRRGAFSAVLTGNAESGVGPAIAAVSRSLPEGDPATAHDSVRPIGDNPSRIIARRDIGAPVVVVGFAAPAPGSADFGGMLVAQAILGNAFSDDMSPANSRGVGAIYLYDSVPSSLAFYVNGGRIDPSVGLREMLLVSKSLSDRQLSADSLARFKTLARSALLVDTVSLSDRSYILGTFAGEEQTPDAINAALDAVDKTTPADLQRVAKQYLQKYIVAVVLPRNANAGT